MKQTTKTEQTEQNTKKRIFMVSARLFAQYGYNGVSMREISENSGVSKPTIYYYYGSKEGIYRALLDVGFKYTDETIQQIKEINASVKTKLTELTKKRFQDTLRYPEITYFYIGLFVTSEKFPFIENFKKSSIELGKVIIDMIKEGIQTGEIAADVSPNLAFNIYGGVLIHYIWQQLQSEKKILSDNLAGQIVEQLFTGFGRK